MSAQSQRRHPAPASPRSLRRPPEQEKPFVQRYRGWILAGIGLAAVIAAIVIFAIKFGPSSSGKQQAAGDQPADPGVVAAVTGVPQATLDAIGVGSATNAPKAISGPALTQD